MNYRLPPALWSGTWLGITLSLYATDGNALQPSGGAADLLNSGERRRAARFHFETDRSRWILSRAIVRLHLAEQLNAAPQALEFQEGPHGKPELSGHPGFHFNWSHSADTVAVASGPAPVGIDIEQHRSGLPYAQLAGHAFPPGEAAGLNGSPDPLRQFYRLWTAREAVMKCTGLGMSLPPSLIAVECTGRGIPETAIRMDDRSRFLLNAREPFAGLSLCTAQMEPMA